MARSTQYFVAALLLCICAFLRPAAADHWPRFRGPEGRGSSGSSNLPVQWTDGDYAWKAKLPGVGHSSPIVWDDRVVVTSGNTADAKRYVLCFRARDGKRLWQREFATGTHDLHTRNSYASSTPATNGTAVFVTWATPDSYQLTALSLADGKDRWRVELGPYQSQHGFAISPIVHNGNVIVGNEQLGNSFLAAYDCHDGRQVWMCARKSGKTAYSTPAVYRPEAGKPQLIFHSTEHGVSSIDPATGQENWSLDVFPKRCVSSPLVAGNLVLGSSGQGGGGLAVVAVRPAARGRKAEVVYEIGENAPYVVTPVAHKDWLFLWHDRGTVSCHKLATGQRLWLQRVGGNYSSSPIVVGEHLYCVSDQGEVVVLAAGPKFRQLARNDLGEPSRATPAIADDRMFFRTESQIMALGGSSLR